MKTLLVSVGLGALVSLVALTTPAQTNQNPASAAQSNALALRQYEWKMRTEVQRKGETKNVQVASIRFDNNGQKQTTLISRSPSPIYRNLACAKQSRKRSIRSLGKRFSSWEI